MRDRIIDAIRRLEGRGYSIGDVIVPQAWIRAMGPGPEFLWGGGLDPVAGPFQRRALLLPTDGDDLYTRDYAQGGPPRVITLLDRNIYELIDTEDEMDEKRLKELPPEVGAALEGLINKELASGSKTRFARAGKVAELAQQIAAMYYTRVEDVREAHEAVGMMNLGAPRPPPYPIPQAPEDTVRDAVSTAMPLLRTMTLHTLLMLRPQAEALGLDPKMIDDQLKAAAAKLITDSGSLNPPKPPESAAPALAEASPPASAADGGARPPLRVADVEEVALEWATRPQNE